MARALYALTGQVPLDDLWHFSLRERRWSQLHPAPGGGGGGAWPSARHHHTLTALSPSEGGAPRGALLFGGVGLRAALDDAPLVDASLWWLSFDQPGGWTRVHIPAGASQPDRRLGHGGVGLNASLWLVGGLAVQGAGAADDLDTALRHVWRFGTAGDGGAAGAARLLLPNAAGAAGAAGAVGGCALGCGSHGACDLRHARCVCDPPWSGADCADPSVAAAPSAVRRVLRVFMLLSAAVVGGLGLGYLYSRYSHIFGTKRRGYQRIGEAQRDL